jgi:hypothetical protein
MFQRSPRNQLNPLHSAGLFYPSFCLNLVDNTKFYELRDKEFSNITGAINLKDLAKVKTQKFSLNFS